MDLTNKRILLTGASGGIGRQLATILAAHDANLVLVGRNQEKLTEVLSCLSSNGCRREHQIIVADLNNDVGQKKVVSESATIDVLINLAGINQLAMLAQMDKQQVSDLIQSNLTTPMILCKELLPVLKTRPHAAILNVGSILGSIGVPGSSVYCASKFGLRGFTETLQRELSDTHISVIYVAPRATDTSMNNSATNALNKELGNRVDSPEVVARRIVDALKSNKSHNHYIGWPEKLFVKLNALFPTIVSSSINKQLATVKRHIRPLKPN